MLILFIVLRQLIFTIELVFVFLESKGFLLVVLLLSAECVFNLVAIYSHFLVLLFSILVKILSSVYLFKTVHFYLCVLDIQTSINLPAYVRNEIFYFY